MYFYKKDIRVYNGWKLCLTCLSEYNTKKQVKP